jgi:hypothetical protein
MTKQSGSSNVGVTVSNSGRGVGQQINVSGVGTTGLKVEVGVPRQNIFAQVSGHLAKLLLGSKH